MKSLKVSHFFKRQFQSIEKRLMWRRDLDNAIKDISSYKRELCSPEMMMSVPVLFKGDGYYSCLDMKQNMVELLGLVKALQTITMETVCEIGTYKGGTLFIWCQLAADDAEIFSIDLPGGEFGGGYDKRLLPLIEAFPKTNQKLNTLLGDSHSKEIQNQFAGKLNGRNVDFLFIDGDHTYKGVKQDFEDYSPYVRSGGIIAFHDIVKRKEIPEIEVWRYWNEIKQNYRYHEFIDSDNINRPIGIGFIYKD